ncbi:ABC-type transport auxiliary lipoprotein family protein [Bordetella genomosp. 13]|uniref:ABC-type transport auxiliary lipoprotein family protein n=1 Tax=Bordetella genomosp. 13 TaxID=463040 RepID=UPI0011A9DC60|nr:ABC-type transport auxiliary lipoprotein family protein [Bordetella genomosp. 13]
MKQPLRTHASRAPVSLPGDGPARSGVKRPLAILAVALALGGCSLGKTGPTPTLYDLGADQRSAPALAARAPLSLGFTAVPTLADPGMVWRIGDSASPRAYAQARWAAAPSELVRQRLAERLSRQGAVLAEASTGVPQLQVTLTRFEQVFQPDGSASTGQLALQAVLLADRRVVAQRRVERAVPAASQDAAGGAAALRQATDEAADELAQWLAQAMPASSAAATPEAASGRARPR